MGQLTQEDKARWRGLIAEQRESQQSIAAFCRNRGIRVWQFYEWKKRLSPAEEIPFVAVEVNASKAASPPVPLTTVHSPTIEIRLRRGRSLLVGPDFEAQHLHRLLQILEQES